MKCTANVNSRTHKTMYEMETLTAMIVPVMQCLIFSTIPYAPWPNSPKASRSSASTSNTLSLIVMLVLLSRSAGAVTCGVDSAVMLIFGRGFLTRFPVSSNENYNHKPLDNHTMKTITLPANIMCSENKPVQRFVLKLNNNNNVIQFKE